LGSTALARSGSEASSTTQSQLGASSTEAFARYDDIGMTPVFEPNPTVPESRLAAWLRQSNSSGKRGVAVAAAAAGAAAAAAAGQERESSGVVEGSGGSETSSSGSSGAKEAAFAEQLRRELHPQLGNPNIIK
jgi:hypothetical protein